MTLYSNIPKELQAIPSWCCWRYEDVGASKATKVPYCPQTGKLASVTDPSTWSTFNDAVKNSDVYSGIGFVFSDGDDFSFIDLDNTHGDQIALDRQIKIYREFNSYAEISPSGQGLHIIVRGKVPSGRRRSFIEVYSSHRYATFTGNIYPQNELREIQECQDKLMQLWEQMGSAPQTLGFTGNEKETFTDDEIIRQCVNAVNGDKAHRLLTGNWTDDSYPSQSEADQALINILAFYTQNRSQIKRIFRNSGLGLRPKATRESYLEYTINRAFDRMLPPIDFDGFKNQIETKLANGKDGNTHTQYCSTSEYKTETGNHIKMPIGSVLDTVPMGVKLPPGLLGELAQFIYAAAPRPVEEIALAGAIGLMSGICGRAYNVSGTGLNQYVLLLADTGTGKEAMASGIDKLMNAIRIQVPTSTTYIGPSEIASGQALIKHLNKVSQCFVSILGEFGLRLQSMSSQHASNAEVALRRMLLDLYNKSGHGQIFRPAIYADREKNIDGTNSPAFSILGESTPERFYGSLNEEMIAEGLLPRFMLIEYNGPRPALNKNAVYVEPSFQLIERFASLVANCENLAHNNKNIINVQADADAQQMLDKFDEYATDVINNSRNDLYRQLWNRAHIKALKLSALLAVGVNMIAPMIISEYVEYAINIVKNDIKALSEKFEAGLIGFNNYESKQGKEIIRVIKEYLESDWETVSKYIKENHLHHDKVIPYAYISRRLISTGTFRNDKIGATAAIKRTIQLLIDSDIIREIGKQELATKFNTIQRCFIVSNAKAVL